MDSDQTSLKRRHRETREFGCDIRRSMLSKLDQLDRAYITIYLVLPSADTADRSLLSRLLSFK